MNKRHTLCRDNSRHESLPELIASLGYCCPHAFLQLFHDRQLISARLGVSIRTVAKWKARAKAGGCMCTEVDGCLKDRLEKMKQALAARQG